MGVLATKPLLTQDRLLVIQAINCTRVDHPRITTEILQKITELSLKHDVLTVDEEKIRIEAQKYADTVRKTVIESGEIVQ